MKESDTLLARIVEQPREGSVVCFGECVVHLRVEHFKVSSSRNVFHVEKGWRNGWSSVGLFNMD